MWSWVGLSRDTAKSRSAPRVTAVTSSSIRDGVRCVRSPTTAPVRVPSTVAPASNAGLGRTIAQLMQLDVSDKGKLVGRVLSEALPNRALPAVTSRILISDPAPNGLATVIQPADGW